MQEEILQLNKLLALSRNAEKGYQVAARQANDPALEAALESHRQKRNEFAYELSQQIRIEGGRPEASNDLVASAHRIWINIKGIISGENTRTIVEECLRGERASVKLYEEILNATTFSNDTRMLLSFQARQIKDTVRQLERFL